MEEKDLKVRVLGNRLLIKPNESEKETASGIIITEESQEKKVSGTVHSIGTKVEEVKAGDMVVYDKYSVTEIKIKGELYAVTDELSIIMIIE